MHKSGTTRVGTDMFELHSFDDYYFKRQRNHMDCVSEKPDDTIVSKEGDCAESFWMKSFFDGEIDMSRQTNGKGCAVLNIEDAERLIRCKNPLRDPVVVVKRDDKYELKDGFHRIHEARARNYLKRVWTIVLDMDQDTET